jgi:Asp-tRNA(Asn)/Glu-tRNA(Gln) amidotransferase B subunit
MIRLSLALFVLLLALAGANGDIKQLEVEQAIQKFNEINNDVNLSLHQQDQKLQILKRTNENLQKIVNETRRINVEVLREEALLRQRVIRVAKERGLIDEAEAETAMRLELSSAVYRFIQEQSLLLNTSKET